VGTNVANLDEPLFGVESQMNSPPTSETSMPKKELSLSIRRSKAALLPQVFILHDVGAFGGHLARPRRYGSAALFPLRRGLIEI